MSPYATSSGTCFPKAWEMDWSESWLPQPPAPFLPPPWGNSIMSPVGKGRVGSPLCSPSPCKLQCGRSDVSLESLANAHDPNEDRFVREFEGATPIGKGQFATVFQAMNKLDKHVYAVKVLRNTPGSSQERMNEVCTLASIAAATSTCQNLVRYFSSWMEDGDLYIQTELCSGSLTGTLNQRRLANPSDPRFAQDEIAHVLRHVANGLSALHGLGYAHLDVKPDNILIARASPDDEVCYKLGDFGLATAIPDSVGPVPRGSVNEGDCRYLAREVLRGGVVDVTKADIFALGLVCYEMATNPEDGLPANGEAWQQLRNGQIEDSKLNLSEPFLAMIHRMIDPAAERRPAAKEIAAARCAACGAEAPTTEDSVEALRAQLALARAQVAASEEKARQLAEALARATQ